MKKLFVFKLNGEITKTEALKITEDAEILFEGEIGEEIPTSILTQIEDQKAADDAEKEAEKAAKESLKDLLKDKNAKDSDRIDAIVAYLGLDI